MPPAPLPIAVAVRFKRDEHAVFVNVEIDDPVTQGRYRLRIPVHTLPALGGAIARLQLERPHEFPELLAMHRK